MRYFIFFFLFLISCSNKEKSILITNSDHAQGTYYHIKYLSPNAIDYKSDIDSIIAEIDSSLSTYYKESLISKINNQDTYKTDYLFNDVYFNAKKVYEESNGYFDCSIYPIVSLLGFYEKDFNPSDIDSQQVNNILKNVGFQKIELVKDSIHLPKNMYLDFNSIAQGYTVDLIAQFLNKKNIDNYLIELGGEISASGRNADEDIWKIGVDKPTEKIDTKDRFSFILELENTSLATSGNYRNFYKYKGVKYSHTINPFSGFPVNNRLLSVTVTHDKCSLADAYATAFMAMGVKKTIKFIQSRDDIGVYLIYTNKEGDWKTYFNQNMSSRIIN